MSESQVHCWFYIILLPQGARANLLAEGIADDSIYVTGNTVIVSPIMIYTRLMVKLVSVIANHKVMINQAFECIFLNWQDYIDALLEVNSALRNTPTLENEMARRFLFLDPTKRLLLITGHHRESFGRGFESICRALRQIAERDDVELLYPVHFNPNVHDPARRILGNLPNFDLIAPLDHLPFVYIMGRAYFIITDSGGIQEEAPSLGKPVLVMRDTTERPEAVDAGTVRLVGTETESIVKEIERLLDSVESYQRMTKVHNPYGDGKASQRIARILNYGI